jgi:TolB-like protein
VNPSYTGKTPAGNEAKGEDKISEDEIREELSKVLESPLFVQSDRLGRFLRFTVETTLAGQAEILKEYVIGTEVYDRKPPYHPNIDSIVRSEARRLRSKLKEYYESAGKNDVAFIYYRLGSYVPVFRNRRSQDCDRTVANTMPSKSPAEGHAIAVAVLPFVDVSRSVASNGCAQGITDELIHELARTERFRVTAAGSIAPLVAQALDIPSLARRLGVQVILEGTVREEENRLRIISRIVNANGFLMWSERIETEPATESLFEFSEQTASALVRRVRRLSIP